MNAVAEPYNLLDPAAWANPYPLYRRMREEAPVYWSPALNCWIVTRYRDVHALLHDPRMVSRRSARFSGHLPPEQQKSLDPLEHWFGSWMMFTDPPLHTQLRGLVQTAFTPRIIANFRPRISALVNELIDKGCARGDGQLDVIQDLAWPLPVIVMAEMLGARPEDREPLKAWSTDIASFSSGLRDYQTLLRIQSGVSGMVEYFRAILADNPTPAPNTLLGSLVAARDAGHALDTEVVLSVAAMLMFTGHETTTNLIGNGFLALLRHPDQLALLRAQPSLIESAVEEFLRYDSPVLFSGRTTTEDFDLDGVTIHAGQLLMLSLGAANHDPAQFADAAQLDITRADNRHVAFGYGPHFCLGAALARLEGQIALDALVRRLVNPRLATDTLAWRPLISVHALQALPVAFERTIDHRRWTIDHRPPTTDA